MSTKSLWNLIGVSNENDRSVRSLFIKSGPCTGMACSVDAPMKHIYFSWHSNKKIIILVGTPIKIITRITALSDVAWCASKIKYKKCLIEKKIHRKIDQVKK